MPSSSSFNFRAQATASRSHKDEADTKRVMIRTKYAFCKIKMAKYLVQKAIKHSKTMAGEYYDMCATLFGWELMGLVAHL